jgi:hypothetical protein
LDFGQQARHARVHRIDQDAARVAVLQAALEDVERATNPLEVEQR